MNVPRVVWPAALGHLRGLCALDDVASTMRHNALNEVAGVGALIFRLRRRLETRGSLASEPEIASVFEAIDGRLGGASTRMVVRFLPPPGDRATADALAAVRETCAALNVSATVVAPDPTQAVWGVAADPDELRVALGCLLENSVEAIARAGSGTITITCTVDGDRRMIDVKDDAQAIDSATLERFFEPFFSGWSDRPGLGLKIARRIAQRWGGELLLSCREPRGMSATLLLGSAG